MLQPGSDSYSRPVTLALGEWLVRGGGDARSAMDQVPRVGVSEERAALDCIGTRSRSCGRLTVGGRVSSTSPSRSTRHDHPRHDQETGRSCSEGDEVPREVHSYSGRVDSHSRPGRHGALSESAAPCQPLARVSRISRIARITRIARIARIRRLVVESGSYQRGTAGCRRGACRNLGG